MRELERRALQAIAAVTVASGALQLVAPRAVLEAFAADDGKRTRHFFGTVGMFMVCTGALGLARPDDRAVLLMLAGQKAGASAAVAVGVRRGVMAPLALGVAGFDALSGALALDRWRRLR